MKRLIDAAAVAGVVVFVDAACGPKMELGVEVEDKLGKARPGPRIGAEELADFCGVPSVPFPGVKTLASGLKVDVAVGMMSLDGDVVVSGKKRESSSFMAEYP